MVLGRSALCSLRPRCATCISCCNLLCALECHGRVRPGPQRSHAVLPRLPGEERGLVDGKAGRAEQKIPHLRLPWTGLCTSMCLRLSASPRTHDSWFEIQKAAVPTAVPAVPAVPAEEARTAVLIVLRPGPASTRVLDSDINCSTLLQQYQTS